MRIRKHVAWVMAPLLAAVGLAACSSGNNSSGSGGTTNPNGIVSIGIGEPQHLLPSNATDTNSNQVLVALFDPLVRYDAQNKPIEFAAQSITTTDSKVWDIKLNPAYKFSNGDPVTSQDYINAWNYAAYAPNGQGTNYYFAHIDGYTDLNPSNPKVTPTGKTMKGLKVISPNEFQVTLSAPYADFKTSLGYTAFLPLPTQAFSSPGVISPNFENHLIGDGAFKMTPAGWQQNKEIDVVRSTTYGGTAVPKIGGVDFKIYGDLSTAYRDVQTDTLDILPNPATADLANAATDFGVRYKHSPASAFQFLAFPTYDPKYSNVNVRKAISMAIDRDAIIRTIFSNTQTSARSFVSPVLPGYRANVCGTPCDYNPVAAKALYTANNGPAQLTITYNADGGHKEWVEATCNQLEQNLGVSCLANPVPQFADLLTKVQNKSPGVGMFRLGWVMDYPSMEDYLTPLYSTHGSSNYYGYSNPKFDQLVQEGSQQATQEAAIQRYQQAEDILAQDMPVIPLRFGQNNFVFSTFVHNVNMDLFSNVVLYQLTTTRK
jgi:peptide/nickel transport system substrate-binding protein/oligopeptide transport system substrate-binding protein